MSLCIKGKTVYAMIFVASNPYIYYFLLLILYYIYTSIFQYYFQIEKGDVVEIFFISEGRNGGVNQAFDLMDTMHIHGYAFHVLAIERHGIMNENVELNWVDTPKGNGII